MRSQHEHTETRVVYNKARSERQGAWVGVATAQSGRGDVQVGAMIDKDGRIKAVGEWEMYTGAIGEHRGGNSVSHSTSIGAAQSRETGLEDKGSGASFRHAVLNAEAEEGVCDGHEAEDGTHGVGGRRIVQRARNRCVYAFPNATVSEALRSQRTRRRPHNG